MTLMKRRILAATLLASGLAAGSAHAAVVIHGTRVIYPASEKEVTVQLENKGQQPALVQLWVDDGDGVPPSEAKVPFVLTPAMSRIEAKRGQSIRLIAGDAHLPADKESLFWLNMLDIPPKNPSDASDKQAMRVAIKTRIKLLYRPKGLSGDPVQAPSELRWSASTGNDGNIQLQATNPTPYYVNFISIGMKQGDGTVIPYAGGGGMVAPGETASFPIQGIRNTSGASVVFEAISDLGARLPHTQPLAAGH